MNTYTNLAGNKPVWPSLQEDGFLADVWSQEQVSIKLGVDNATSYRIIGGASGLAKFSKQTDGSLPDGIRFNEATGEFYGTEKGNGFYPKAFYFYIRAYNENGHADRVVRFDIRGKRQA